MNKLSRRKFFQIIIKGAAALGLAGGSSFSIAEVNDENELKGIKIELSDGTILGFDVPEGVISRRKLEEIIRKIKGTKLVFPKSIGYETFDALKDKDEFHFFFKPSESFITEYFSPYISSLGVAVSNETFVFTIYVLAVTVAIYQYIVAVVVILVVAAIIIPPVFSAEIYERFLSERGKLINAGLYNMGEFPIKIESSKGTIQLKYIETATEVKIEDSISSFPLLPVETEFGTIIQHIGKPSESSEVVKKLVEECFTQLESGASEIVLEQEYEGETYRIYIPREVIENAKLLKERLQ